MLACHNNPAASAVATVSAVVYVIAAIVFPWVPTVVMIFFVASVPAAVVVLYALTSQDSLLWQKSLLLQPPLLLLMFFILLVIQPFWSTCCVPVVVGVPALAGIPTVDNNPSVNVVSTILVSLLLVSLDVPTVFCSVVSQFVYVNCFQIPWSSCCGMPTVVNMPSTT
jgi:hypothetical protein